MLAFGFLLCALGVGCKGGAVQPPKPPYSGPTLTMYEVVERINANNSKITSLWSRHEFEANIYDEKTKKLHFVNGDGLLLYQPEMNLRLTGTKPAVGSIFEIGSNSERYWLRVVPETETMWWGRYEHLGSDCAEEIPIRPDLILEVLGVSTINRDFTEPPAPTMRFNPDADAYMFVWSKPFPDRWIAQKEVWYDRKTLRPTLVVLFDENGRPVLRAYLSEHQRVELPDVVKEQRPYVATKYDLFFPDTRSTMDISLTNPRLQQGGAPNDKSFQFPAKPGVSNVVQLDEACGP